VRQPRAADSRPNVLFILADDQRYDTIGALGNEEISTPNLDALVRSGTAFTSAHIMGGSHQAVCMPSRAMLLTGRSLFHLDRQGQDIPTNHAMFPEVLRSRGYTTFGTGKWHNGPASFSRCFSEGDSIFFGGMHDHFTMPLHNFDLSGGYPEGSHTVAQDRHSTDIFAKSVERFLGDYDDAAPFLAYLSFTAPHDPRDTHPRYHAMYEPDSLELPDSFMTEHPFDNGELRVRDELLAPFPRTPGDIRRHIAEYYAMITHLDDRIGRVMAALESSGRADDTIVVFAGDNGLALGRHGLMGKQNLYEHSVRVPLVLSGPGIPQDQTNDALVYLSDVYATLFELVGEPLPDSVEGASLVPVMHTAESGPRDTLFTAYRGYQRAVRDRRHKLIEYSVGANRRTQLFDLVADPCETNDLSGDTASARTLTRLGAELTRWQTDLDDPTPIAV
jgi:arylsulfatase A-like enzyme